MIQGIAADRCESCNTVGDHVHGMICEHSSHRESREVYFSWVDVVLLNHLFDNLQDKVDILSAIEIPRIVDALWEYGDELCRISH